MERKIEKKCELFVQQFKNNVDNWIKHNACDVICKTTGQNKTSEFLQFLYDNEDHNIKFHKEDFQKRKRSKNVIPLYERCIAKRASGEQCTRRKKNGCDFCGTHHNNTPHGAVNCTYNTHKNTIEEPDVIQKKIEIWLQEIKGINYYVDDDENVYEPADILNHVSNPRVLAKYKKMEDGTYVIPDYDNIL